MLWESVITVEFQYFLHILIVKVDASPPVTVVHSRRPNSKVSEDNSTMPAVNSTAPPPPPSTTETHLDDGFTLIQSTKELKEPSNRLGQMPNGW